MHRYGIERAIVRDVKDPLRKGRLKIELSHGGGVQQWAAVLRPIGARGAIAKPQPGDEVWVEFEAGDPSSPVFVGAFWSGDGEPPAPANADGEGVMHRNGIERGIVTDVEDPVRKGRLQIELPVLAEKSILEEHLEPQAVQRIGSWGCGRYSGPSSGR